MKHISTAWLLPFLLSCFFSAAGQTTTQSLSRFDHKVIPPSPGATQLGIFGSVPPDLNTGAVQTSVPLLEIKSRQLTLPVTLNYSYKGLMVDELASWVGLGWTLNVGLVITWPVRGWPDVPRSSSARLA